MFKRNWLWSVVVLWLLVDIAGAVTIISQSVNTEITLGLAISQVEFENPLSGSETVAGYTVVDWQDADYQAPAWYDDWTVSHPGAIDGWPSEIWLRQRGHSGWATTLVPSKVVSIHLVGDDNDGLAQALVDGVEVARLDMGTFPGTQTALIVVKDLPFKCHRVQVNDQGQGQRGDDVAILGAAALMKGYRVKWSQPPVVSLESPFPDCFWGWDVTSIFMQPALWFDCWNCPTQCHGDANCDGRVTMIDLSILMAAMGSVYPNPPYNPCADFNRDLKVDAQDQVILMQYYQALPPPSDCPAAPAFRPQILADDWACRDNRPISDIHWWGSYQKYDGPEPLANGPAAFHIAIWTDVKAGAGRPWSHPGMVVRDWFVAREALQERYAGCDFYPLTPGSEPMMDSCFEYHFNIPEELWFYQEPDATQEKIYWVSIAAIYPDMIVPQNIWGWKCRPHFFNDDAVRIYSPTAPGVEWSFQDGEPLVDSQGNSMDMAFVLTTAEIPDLDFGDVPEDNTLYPATRARDGARHLIDGKTFLGQTVDKERDGQPTVPADGDDLNPLTAIDDEDGVSFPGQLYAGFPARVVVTASVNGYLDAWFDFNQDGDWDDADERVFLAQALAAGDNTLEFFVPASSGSITDRPCYARFRFSTIGELAYSGLADNGEVEDYAVVINPVPYYADLGDAPDSTNNHFVAMTAYANGTQANYPTVFQAPAGMGGWPGPIHYHPQAIAWLGKAVSVEVEADNGPDMDGISNIIPPANQPDNDKADDGLILPVQMAHCRWTSINYRVNYAALVMPPFPDLYVNVWSDWNRDGDWDDVMPCPKGPAPEWIVQNQLLLNLHPGINKITSPGFLGWHNPQLPKELWLRITLAEQPWRPAPQRPGGSGSYNGYEFGETEDYLIVPETGCLECADLNCDQFVDLADFKILSQQWLTSCP